jgi:hypothetical protein
MKKILISSFLFAMLCAVTAFAQQLESNVKIQRPDYSGTWKLNRKKSRGVKKLDKDETGIKFIMVIEQKLPAIEITFKNQRGIGANENFFGGKATFYTDGRGDEIIAGMPGETSTSQWKNNKLTVTHFGNYESNRGEIISIDEYSLSPDGKTLTNTMRSTSVRYNAQLKEERFFDESETLVLVFDKVR